MPTINLPRSQYQPITPAEARKARAMINDPSITQRVDQTCERIDRMLASDAPDQHGTWQITVHDQRVALVIMDRYRGASWQVVRSGNVITFKEP